MMLDADVLVAGGGLAGAVAALHLGRAGLSVQVVDRAEFPRDKPCGEGLLPHGVALLRAWGLGDLLERCEAQPFRGIRYRCGGVTADGDFAAGSSGRGVRRLRLDDELRRAAAATGAVGFQRAGVRGVGVDQLGATLRLDDGRILRARFLVGADGPRSTVRHALSLDGGAPERGRWALRGHFRLPPGAPLPERVEVDVRGGYELYVTPAAPGLLGVAALVEQSVMRAGNGTPAARLAALIGPSAEVGRRLEGATPEGEVLACGPLRVRARAVHRDRALLVGDAAGYVDAITGEGMSLALRGAELAAAAVADVLAERSSLAAAMRRYARARAAIFRDHALLTHGLVFLARHPQLARRAVARLAREPEIFARLLEVNDGTRRLHALPLADLLKLAIGASAPTPRRAAATARGSAAE